MTLLRVYNNNGHEAANASSDYRFSDIMHDFFGDTGVRNFSTPRVNVMEDNESFTILMALPGVEKSELSINIDKDVLVISRKKDEESNAQVNYTRREFDFGSFERSFDLPEDINVEKINASMENGILTVYLPKKDEAVDRGPVQISIS
ncbi:MAG TPA: Hsp20/alpha crystallin family protein [Bacteroidales bacterium]|nr:Hsp20/alpha crystallin family protein [Bacteroidales bacterium]